MILPSETLIRRDLGGLRKKKTGGCGISFSFAWSVRGTRRPSAWAGRRMAGDEFRFRSRTQLVLHPRLENLCSHRTLRRDGICIHSGGGDAAIVRLCG